MVLVRGTHPVPTDDNDADGVSNNQEALDGTDPDDPGSFRVHLQNPVYALWTGFLDITNILELVNTGDATLSPKIALFSIDGLNCKQVTVSTPAGGQRDVILNQFLSFSANTYGLVNLTVPAGVKLFGELLRIKIGQGSQKVYFAMPTEVR